MLTTNEIIVSVTLLALLIVIYKELLRPAVAFLLAVVILLCVGVLKPKEALEGFANEQLAIIILLLVISDIIRKSSVIDVFFNKILGKTTSDKKFSLKFMSLSAGLSSFLNNTPIVAILMPYINNWSKKNNVSPSRFLIPLSYATILGGCVTLIGTSTNLLVNGLAVNMGLDALEVFEFAPVGLTMAVVGIIYLALVGKKLLPNKKTADIDKKDTSREYFIETRVLSDSPIVSKSVLEAGLRNLNNLFLVEIVRNNKVIGPVSHDFVIEADDTLIFVGNTSMIDDLKSPSLGLGLPKSCELYSNSSHLSEIVISHNSGLHNKTVKESNFRSKYDAAIVAVHRNGEKLSGKIGDIILKAGDVLLVLAGVDFQQRTQGNQAFYTISEYKPEKAPDVWKVLLIIAGLLASISLSIVEILPLFTGLCITLGMALLLNVVPFTEIRKGIDLNLILLIAMGLAFGKAMINTGLAERLANNLGVVLTPIGLIGTLAGIFLITNLLSAYITNKAAAAIVLPVSVAIASNFSVGVTPFVLIVAFGAAASFITPIGYQTNLMVYGPGGYSFKDFFKIGLPLTILYMIGSAVILAYQYGGF
jgi:di/tricarboxylate transporter